MNNKIMKMIKFINNHINKKNNPLVKRINKYKILIIDYNYKTRKIKINNKPLIFKFKVHKIKNK